MLLQKVLNALTLATAIEYVLHDLAHLTNWKVMPKLGLQLEQTLMGDTAQAEATLSTQRLSSQASDTGKSLFRAMVGVSATHQSGLTVGVDAASEQGSNASGTTGRLSLSKSF